MNPLDVVRSWPVHATVGVADRRGILATSDGTGHGTGRTRPGFGTDLPPKMGGRSVANIGPPLGLADEARPWASVTKLLTALATLVAVEEGVVDLDAPAGPPGSTLRHLLAHASGLPLDGDRPIAKVGARRIYSNRGIELAAELVATQSGMAFVDYLSEGVLGPLGLEATTVHGSAAWGAMGPLRDLLALGTELLAPTVIGAATLRDATGVAFPGLSGVLPGFGAQASNDWGLGFELRDHKSPHWTGRRNSPRTFGHFGRSGSFLWVDPDAGLACGGLADRPFGPWAVECWPPLADAVLEEFSPRP